MAALGKAIDWTDEQLDRLAEVSPADVERSVAWWHDRAGRLYEHLIDAQPRIDEQVEIAQ